MTRRGGRGCHAPRSARCCRVLMRRQRRRVEPDWAALNRELKRKHVTLQILWDEYIEGYPDGYRYGRFCDLYRGWEPRLPVTRRQTHLRGDKLFVDYGLGNDWAQNASICR